MRLHVVSLPHTQTTHDYVFDPFTQKVVKLAKMMLAERHEVFLYAGDENCAPCTEHVPLFTEAERHAWYGENDPNSTRSAPPFSWDPRTGGWPAMAERAARAIAERSISRDLLLLIGGTAQQPIAQALPQLRALEFGVGYEGIFADFCAFESYAWMHYVYGKRRVEDGRYFDVVIPNYFDAEDFHLSETKDEYLLFIGRIIRRKGPHVAAALAERAGMPLVIAGPGATSPRAGCVVGADIEVAGDHIRYVGPVGREARAELMARARAILVPTTYIEPFGGVAIEAAMCGTPVVASDWGAFSETVTPALGRRFSTLREGVAALEGVLGLDPRAVRDSALADYSLEAVGPRYTAWFDRIATLDGAGWYA